MGLSLIYPSLTSLLPTSSEFLPCSKDIKETEQVEMGGYLWKNAEGLNVTERLRTKMADEIQG